MSNDSVAGEIADRRLGTFFAATSWFLLDDDLIDLTIATHVTIIVLDTTLDHLLALKRSPMATINSLDHESAIAHLGRSTIAV
jgi:hypothetical protein